MQWWNRLKSILTSKLQIKSSLTKLTPNELSICFVENGGLGDCLILFPLLEQIKQQAPCPIQIDFFSKFGNKFHSFPFLRAIYPSPKDVTCLSNHYDVVFVQLRHAHVLSANEPKVQQLYPKLFEFIATDKKLKNNPFIYNNFRLFNEYALLLNCKRKDQRDIFHIFGKIPAWNWPIHTPEKEVLKKFHLNSKQYITLSRGVDSVYNENHPKLWPLAYYNQLIELLKQKYPQLQLIQVGSSAVYGTMQNTTFNLTGKTNFDEIAIILKNALIHIDVEGGLVHLNHYVGGKSCVLFGPTSPAVFGYPENINLCSKACPMNCDWLAPDWTQSCLRKQNPAPCMNSLLPQMVLNSLIEHNVFETLD